MQLLKNAWDGWLSVTDDGKLMAILLAIILFYCFTKNQVKEHLLFRYTTVMTVLCILPVSAAVFMAYQTRFYGYQWIWTYVPVTAFIAFGGTVFLCDFWEDCKRERIQKAVVTAGLLAALLMCGRMGNAKWNVVSVKQPLTAVENLLSEIVRDSAEPVCLWGPEEVVEYARSVRGDIELFYGRNMWDKSLNAYSYDTYPEEKEVCYQWMIYAQDWGGLENSVNIAGEKIFFNGVECIRTAVKDGVNVICLPGRMTEETLEVFESELGMTFVKYGEWLVWIAQKIN